ncbi:GtrA family protein [Streptococcus suis]|nr:GtrA family protein [Streptococcus suis]
MNKLLNNEVLAYLIFGVLTTLVYIVTRTALFTITNQATSSAVVANVVAILFAFVTNDTIVFKQERQGWFKRLISFIGARLFTLALDLLLAVLLVEQYPGIIGQFVNDNLKQVNFIETLIAQILIIVANYAISKWLVFRNQKRVD